MRLASRPARFVLQVLLLLSLSTLSRAGDLSDFESSATKRRQDAPSRRNSAEEDCDDDESFLDSLFSDFLGGALSVLIVEPGKLSLERVGPQIAGEPFGVGRRALGDPDLPFVATDLNYQWVQPDISAIDIRGEVGYGPFGFQARGTHYEEKSPRDELDVVHLHGLGRLSAGRMFQFNWGFGAVILSGRRTHSGFSMTTPIFIRPEKHLAFRLIPTWSWISGNQINDYDGSVEYVHSFYSIRAGYRTNRVSSESLHGPYVGVSFHY